METEGFIEGDKTEARSEHTDISVPCMHSFPLKHYSHMTVKAMAPTTQLSEQDCRSRLTAVPAGQEPHRNPAHISNNTCEQSFTYTGQASHTLRQNKTELLLYIYTYNCLSLHAEVCCSLKRVTIKVAQCMSNYGLHYNWA